MKRNLVFLLLFTMLRSLTGQTDTTTLISPEFAERFSVKEININSNRSDFSPFLLNDKLYFVSNRKITFGVIFKGDDFTDVYTSTKKDSVTFSETELFKLINSVTNDGPVSVDRSGKSLYFSTNEKKYDFLIKEVETEKKLKIYYSTFENGKWSNPKLHPVCTENSSYCHPSISADNKTLYFTADLPGGFGGMDLYSSTFENNSWSKPVNLGSEINTADDEIFPFVNSSGKIFFSSTRKSGLGGLDIYVVEKSESGETSVHLASKAINSPFDDFGIWTDSTFEKGYLSTNRVNGNDEIFYFEKTVPDFNDCVTMKHNLCYSFFEESTLQAEDTLGMTYEWTFGDGTKERGIKVKHCFPHPGSYLVELNIVEKSSGQLFYNELTYDFTTVDPDQLFISCPDTVGTDFPFLVDASQSKITGFSILKYYWIFSDTCFSTGIKTRHSYYSNGDYVIKLGVLVQNDSTKALSTFCTEKRVYVGDFDWFSKNGTKANLPYDRPQIRDSLYYAKEGEDISFKVNLGTSEKQLSKTSYVFSGMEKIEEHKEKGYYRYTTGSEQKVSDIIYYYKAAKAKGFNEAVVISYYRDTLIPGQEKSLKGTITDTSTGTYDVVIYFDNIKEAEAIKAKLLQSDSAGHGSLVNIPYSEVKKTFPNLVIDSTYNYGPLDVQWFIEKSLRDTAIYHKFLSEAGNYYDKNIIYKVQIGAYRYPENFKYPQLAVFGKAEIIAYPDGITRFTMKEFKTVREAEVFRQQCIRKGIPDAWITAVYNGERYTLEQLIANYFFAKISG